MGQPVVHFEVLGQDASALQGFYRALFDWQVSADNPFNYGEVDTRAGTGISGGIGPAQGGSGGVTFYVQVPDLQAYLDRAEKLGGRTLMPPTEVPGTGVRLAQVADPEGNRIGLVQG